MDAKFAQPKDAAAVILHRVPADTQKPEICWARRSQQLKFLPGYHAFPGGRLEPNDCSIAIKNCGDKQLASLIVCAARECFEESGVLLARGCEKMTKGQRASLHDDLVSGRMSFNEILEHWSLWLDAVDFTFAGTYTTPPFALTRFKTRFFLVECPPKQIPYSASGEIENVEFIPANEALIKWEHGEILCAPPILNTLRVLSKGFDESSVKKLLKLAQVEGEHPRKIELNPHVTVFPLRTLTLPPATHTNCFIVGNREFVVIDAASSRETEQTALHEFIDSLIETGGVCRAIILSHLHSDHFGGEQALQKHLKEKFKQQAPIVAHSLTIQNLPHIRFDESIDEHNFYRLSDKDGVSFDLKVMHLPGHARGHLCFYDSDFGLLLSSDNVVGTGSVLISPPEGNMKDYLYSLKQMQDLLDLRFLCGSHGPAVANAKEKIESYLAHRNEREQEILEAYTEGLTIPRKIVEKVYANVNPSLWGFAENSVLAHLEKLREENRI